MANNDPIKDDTRKTFEHSGKKYFINPPSSEVVRKSEWHHAKVYNEAVAEGVYTAHEMEELLRRRGLIGAEYDKEIVAARASLQESLVRLELANLEPDIQDDILEEIAIEVSKARDELYKLNLRYSNPMNTTCEKLAEDAKVDYIISAVVVDEHGNRVWPTYVDFMNDTDVNFVVTAKTQVYLWLQGIDSDMFTKVPEHMVFKKLDEKRKVRVQKALDDIQKSIEDVENAQAAINEEAAAKEAAASKEETTVKKKRKKKEELTEEAV